MMNKLLRVRGLIDSSKGASDMSNWKLLKSGTIEEETQSIGIDLDGEYEELDILILVHGTSSNESINNLNGYIDFRLSNDTNTGGYVTPLAYKGTIQRLVRLKCEISPYFNCSYQTISNANINKISSASLANQGGFFDRNFNEKIKAITINTQVGFFGVGTEYAIYGK